MGGENDSEINRVVDRVVEGWRNFYSSEVDKARAREIVSAGWKSFQGKVKSTNVALAQAVEAAARLQGKEIRKGFQQRRARGKSPAAGARAESTPPRGGGGSAAAGEGDTGNEEKGWDTAGPRARGSAAAKRAASARRSPPVGNGSPADKDRKCTWEEQTLRQTFYTEDVKPGVEFADGGSGVMPVNVHTFYDRFPITSEYPIAAIIPENWQEIRERLKKDQKKTNEEEINKFITDSGIKHAFVADDPKAGQGYPKRGVLVNVGQSVINVALTDLAAHVKTTPNILTAKNLKEITITGKRKHFEQTNSLVVWAKYEKEGASRLKCDLETLGKDKEVRVHSWRFDAKGGQFSAVAKAKAETTRDIQDKLWSLTLTCRPTIWPGMAQEGAKGDGDCTRIWLGASVGWPEALRSGRGLGNKFKGIVQMSNPEKLGIRVLITDAAMIQEKLLPAGERLPTECVNINTTVTAVVRGLPADLTRAEVAQQLLGLGIVAQPHKEINTSNRGPQAVVSWKVGLVAKPADDFYKIGENIITINVDEVQQPPGPRTLASWVPPLPALTADATDVEMNEQTNANVAPSEPRTGSSDAAVGGPRTGSPPTAGGGNLGARPPAATASGGPRTGSPRAAAGGVRFQEPPQITMQAVQEMIEKSKHDTVQEIKNAVKQEWDASAGARLNKMEAKQKETEGTITGMSSMLQALCTKMGVVTEPPKEEEAPSAAAPSAEGVAAEGLPGTTEVDRRRPPNDIEAKEEEAITRNEKSAAKKTKGADQKDEL